MYVLSWYVLNVKPYIQLLLCVYGIYFAAKYNFQRFIKSQGGFSNAGAGAGYTFYPHSSETPQRIGVALQAWHKRRTVTRMRKIKLVLF